MGIVEILLIGLGLSMDAVAVSMSDGMCYKNLTKTKTFLIPLFFGVFQGLMPTIGFFIGGLLPDAAEQYAGIVTLVILGVIGGKMVYDGIAESTDTKSCEKEKTLSYRVLLLQAVATSIDALAVGVGFSVSGVEIFSAAPIIALTTFVCSLVAVFVGKKFGDVFGNKAEIFGGAILIIIGLKSFITSIF